MRCTCLSLVISLSLLTCGARVSNARQTAGAGVDRARAEAAAQAGTPAPPDKRSEKLRRAVEKIGVGGRITVVAKDGPDQRGFVESFDGVGFQTVERKTQRVVAFKYAEVKRTGRGWRKPPGALKMGIFAVALVGGPRHRDPHRLKGAVLTVEDASGT